MLSPKWKRPHLQVDTLQIHDDILLAFKDYSNNLQQTMQGINLNNINITFNQSLDSMHESNVKIEQALQNLDK
jgi:hypothetical protein